MESLLAALVRSDVDFIVVGGMAAALHGAPVVTQDLDIVHSKSHENVVKLLKLLKKISAKYRGQPKGLVLRPSSVELEGGGHLNLITSLGPLDVLCEIGEAESYDNLIGHTLVFSDGELSFRVLKLEKLIELKKKSPRTKDRLMLPLLIAAFKQRG
jgi:hypothetical protein